MNAPKTAQEANEQLSQIDIQTQLRGTNSDEYQIYVACMEGTDEKIKPYNEWLNS